MREYSILVKALSEEVRLRIIILPSRSELCVADLVAVLKLPQSTVSRHLAGLERHLADPGRSLPTLKLIPGLGFRPTSPGPAGVGA